MSSNEVTWTEIPLGETVVKGVEISGQWWVRMDDLSTPFGVSKSALLKAISRNVGTLLPEHELMFPVQTAGGEQMVRVVSLPGILRLTALIRTDEARKTLCSIVDRCIFGVRRTLKLPPPSQPGTFRVSADMVRMLNTLAPAMEPGTLVAELAADLRCGARPLAADPGLDALVKASEELDALNSEVMKKRRHIRVQAERLGYIEEAVVAEKRRRRRQQTQIAGTSAQPSLTFDRSAEESA